jgi:hypothetical protein
MHFDMRIKAIFYCRNQLFCFVGDMQAQFLICCNPFRLMALPLFINPVYGISVFLHDYFSFERQFRRHLPGVYAPLVGQ